MTLAANGLNPGTKIYTWTYADAAARTGATGFVAGDVGSVALQLDDGTLWRLTATTPTWQAFSGGVANPMTTAGDIIYGGASGVPTRLAKGGNNTVLGVDGSGAFGYKADPSGGGARTLFQADGSLAHGATAFPPAAFFPFATEIRKQGLTHASDPVITIDDAGAYRFTLEVRLPAANYTDVICFFYKNTSTLASPTREAFRGEVTGATGVSTVFQVIATEECAASDEIRFAFYQDSGGTRTIVCRVTAERIDV